MESGRLILGIKDCLFPIFCLGCKEEGVWICDRCLLTIPTNGVFCCPVCHTPTPAGNTCQRCRHESHIARAIAVTPYEETRLIGHMMWAFKYEYAEALLITWQRLIEAFLARERPWFHEVEVIVPIPLHPRRYAERGFDQATLIANIVGHLTRIPVISALRRTRYTSQQARLNKAARTNNVQGAFVVMDSPAIINKNIVLVDDVFTTGSTMAECARALSPYTRRVSGFTIARG